MKHFIAHTVAALSLIALCGCATPQNNYKPAAMEISTPAINKESVAQIGEEMLKQGKYYEGEGIRLAEEIKFGGMFTYYTMTPGEYVKVGEDKNSGFYKPSSGPRGGDVKKAALADPWESIQFLKDGSEIAIVTIFHLRVAEKNKGVTQIKIPVLADDAFQQTLIYSGKVGNKVKIGYREFSNNVARPAFNNDVDYDLTDSPVIGYKGARIEVLEATNQYIRYRVLQNFNQATQ
jgi:hypothetical protein